MADEISLVAAPRTTLGTRPTRRLRHEGHIPGVIYGNGVDAIAVTVEARDLRHALTTPAGLNAVLTMLVGDKKYTALAREIQRHPVRGSVTHVDYQVVDPDRPVSAEVPLVLIGEAVELHRQGGVLDQSLFSITVHAKPSEIPQQFEVDISNFDVGSALRISEVAVPAGVEIDLDPETLIASGQAPRVATEGEGAPGAEGEEGGGEATTEGSGGGES
jgi:large subunit ribosomal protein L25